MDILALKHMIQQLHNKNTVTDRINLVYNWMNDIDKNISQIEFIELIKCCITQDTNCTLEQISEEFKIKTINKVSDICPSCGTDWYNEGHEFGCTYFSNHK